MSNRIVLDSIEMESAYHVMTRCVNGENLLDEPSRETLRKMIWRVSEFCNVEVITYAILPNHFHILLKIPQRTVISDRELLRRYAILHPVYSSYMPARIEVIADWLKHDTREGRAWREQQLALMFNLSAFMKLLKIRFTKWFNLTHNRFGTLWSERFKSVLVEYEGYTLRTMAAYVDLNAVRKGLVADPKDYRFCGYAEALAGSRRARAGLRHITDESSWSRSQREYRLLLYSTGAAPRAKGHVINPLAFSAVIDANGDIPLPDLLRHKWRYLTNGVILGSAPFVKKHAALLPPSAKTPPTPAHKPAYVPSHGPWGHLTTAQRVNTTKH